MISPLPPLHKYTDSQVSIAFQAAATRPQDNGRQLAMMHTIAATAVSYRQRVSEGHCSFAATFRFRQILAGPLPPAGRPSPAATAASRFQGQPRPPGFRQCAADSQPIDGPAAAAITMPAADTDSRFS